MYVFTGLSNMNQLTFFIRETMDEETTHTPSSPNRLTVCAESWPRLVPPCVVRETRLNS